MNYLSLVLFAALAVVAHTDRCYLFVSSPDEINGIYAPYDTDSWSMLTDGGFFAYHRLRRDADGKYFFFIGERKIGNEADVEFTTDKKCIKPKDDFLNAWPKTSVFSMPYPIGGPFLGEIEGFEHSVQAEKKTYLDCFNWAMKQRSALRFPASGLTWHYNGVCRAVWGGTHTNNKAALPSDSNSRNKENAPSWIHKHPRSQFLKAHPAQGSTMERIYFGRAQGIRNCYEKAKLQGEPAAIITYRSGGCYRSNDSAIEQYTHVPSNSDTTYFRVDYPGDPQIFSKQTFHCTENTA